MDPELKELVDTVQLEWLDVDEGLTDRQKEALTNDDSALSFWLEHEVTRWKDGGELHMADEKSSEDLAFYAEHFALMSRVAKYLEGKALW